MWPRRSYISSLLIEANIVTKGRKTLWNDTMEYSFKAIKRMTSSYTLLNYPDWKLLSLYTQMIMINSWVLLSVRIINLLNFLKETKQSTTWINYDREWTSTVSGMPKAITMDFIWLWNKRFSDYKNLVYAKTLSESQRVMHGKLILKDSGPNIQHIDGVDNIGAYLISILLSTSFYKYNPSTIKYQCRANKLFSISRDENNEDYLTLDLLNAQREQKKIQDK